VLILYLHVVIRVKAFKVLILTSFVRFIIPQGMLLTHALSAVSPVINQCSLPTLHSILSMLVNKSGIPILLQHRTCRQIMVIYSLSPLIPIQVLLKLVIVTFFLFVVLAILSFILHLIPLASPLFRMSLNFIITSCLSNVDLTHKCMV